MTDTAAILTDLARVRCIFQLRTITAAMGVHPVRQHQHGNSEAAAERGRAVDHFHTKEHSDAR
ncbi:hypothetical protein [Sphingomonas baiyangensis]|uniref:Uncharacterized protein n=1 Tax=Sphingomonas baiyangensis TaxID=2572576 RepID=A0A4U1L1W7_9SPHN|nr:hypothetical protein [Sphingomonas baiyangensis]TKD50200.1 hypothetical protein FBR43_05100 [Sphingomonas baiyangensis]